MIGSLVLIALLLAAAFVSWLHSRVSIAERIVYRLYWVAVRVSASAVAADNALVTYRREKEQLRGVVPACAWGNTADEQGAR
jgi:hypothetical protein